MYKIYQIIFLVYLCSLIFEITDCLAKENISGCTFTVIDWIKFVNSVLFSNKKVLLCERKMHTDCGVSSTPSVVLYRGGDPLLGGTPCQGEGYPINGRSTSRLDLGRYRPSEPGQVPPFQYWIFRDGYPLPRLDGGTRRPGMGVPP